MARNKKKHSTPKASEKIADALIEAALTYTHKNSWNKLSLLWIAKKTNNSLAVVEHHFPNLEALILAIPGYFDRCLIRTLNPSKGSGSDHDRLFETIITRFELIDPYRQSIIGLLEYFKSNPSLLPRLVPSLYQSAQKTLDFSQVTVKPKNLKTIVAFGLIGIITATFFTWTRDPSKDLSKTMASLNRLLLQGEKLLKLTNGLK